MFPLSSALDYTWGKNKINGTEVSSSEVYERSFLEHFKRVYLEAVNGVVFTYSAKFSTYIILGRALLCNKSLAIYTTSMNHAIRGLERVLG